MNKILENLIIEEYLNQKRKSMNYIAKKYGISDSSVKKILILNNIKIENTHSVLRKNRVRLNENFFDNLNNELSAYVLGFFIADGYHNQFSNRFEISSSEKDKEILIKIKSAMEFEGNLYEYEYKGDTNRKNKIILSFTNKKISRRLLELGIINDKTWLAKFPEEITKNYRRHFLRGLFDGDGSINSYKKRKSYEFGIVGAKDLIEKCSEIFYEDLGIKMNVHKRLNIYGFRTSKKHEILQIMDYFYDDSTIFLERKKNIFNVLKELCETQCIFKNGVYYFRDSNNDKWKNSKNPTRNS